jgi:hypothetical protein
MQRRPRRNHIPALKAKVALAAIKGGSILASNRQASLRHRLTAPTFAPLTFAGSPVSRELCAEGGAQSCPSRPALRGSAGDPAAQARDSILDQFIVASRLSVLLERGRSQPAISPAPCVVSRALLTSIPPAAWFLLRAQQFAAHPPGPDWEPVFTLEGK